MKSKFKPDLSSQQKQNKSSFESQIKEINLQQKDEKETAQDKDKQDTLQKKRTGLSRFGQESKQLQDENVSKDSKQQTTKQITEQKEKKDETIKLEDLRFMLQKDSTLVSSFGGLLKRYIIAQKEYIKKESKIIPQETIEATKFIFEKYCESADFSQKQMREYLNYLEGQALPSINFLILQISLIEFLINDFEKQLKELFIMNQMIAKLNEDNKRNEALQLKSIQEKLVINAEYSGTKLKNKLQIYIKDRNDEIRELILHLNKCKVNYHGQTLTYLSAFFFDILLFDPKEQILLEQKQIKEKIDVKNQKIVTPIKQYKKECKKVLQEYLKEKDVEKYIPNSDDETEIKKVTLETEQNEVTYSSDEDQSIKGHKKENEDDDNYHKKDIVQQVDSEDPIIERMNLDQQFEISKQAPKVKSFLRLSKTQL